MKKLMLTMVMAAFSVIFMIGCGVDNRAEQAKAHRLTMGDIKLDIDMDFTPLNETQFTVKDSIEMLLNNFKYRDELSFASVEGMMSVTKKQLDKSILERDEFLSTDMWGYDQGATRWSFIKDSLRHIVIGNELGILIQNKYGDTDLNTPIYDMVTYKIEFFNPFINSDIITESTYIFKIGSDSLVGILEDGNINYY